MTSGTPLSEALAKHPQSFDGLYTNMVHAGEAGGVLDAILRGWPASWRRRDRHAQEGQGRHDLPGSVVLFVAVSILLVIVIFVVPKFEEVFKQIPGLGELPQITQALQAISKFLVERWYVVFGSIGVLVILFNVCGGASGSATACDKL